MVAVLFGATILKPAQAFISYVPGHSTIRLVLRPTFTSTRPPSSLGWSFRTAFLQSASSTGQPIIGQARAQRGSRARQLSDNVPRLCYLTENCVCYQAPSGYSPSSSHSSRGYSLG